jgi:hypothetical protein
VGVISRGTLLRWHTHWRAVGGAGLSLEAVGAGRSGAEGLLRTAEALSDQALDLRRRLAEVPDRDELAPALIGGTSRMQELINDLLSATRPEGGGDHPRRSAAAEADGPAASSGWTVADAAS